jgi:hypothetical protein
MCKCMQNDRMATNIQHGTSVYTTLRLVYPFECTRVSNNHGDNMLLFNKTEKTNLDIQSTMKNTGSLRLLPA